MILINKMSTLVKVMFGAIMQQAITITIVEQIPSKNQVISLAAGHACHWITMS